MLALWELVHEPLSDGQRAAFLRRPEIEILERLPDGAVRSAISRNRRLSDTSETARRESWWHEGTPCEQDNLPWCSRCKPHPYPAVVTMTRGWGAAFHLDADCRWLVEGQRAVARRGGEPALVERVPVQVAFGAGKSPCLACFPPTAIGAPQ
jgi:hypothetical protein